MLVEVDRGEDVDVVREERVDPRKTDAHFQEGVERASDAVDQREEERSRESRNCYQMKDQPARAKAQRARSERSVGESVVRTS